MSYEEFKAAVLEILKDFYENDAEIHIIDVEKNNRVKLHGLWIKDKEAESGMAPLVYLQNIYKLYQDGLPLEDCVGEIIDFANMNRIPADLVKISKMLLSDWEHAKSRVYPIILAGKPEGKELSDMVSRGFLDMSVAYIIRDKILDGVNFSIRISHKILKQYGISEEELHNQAMENLRHDEYVLQDFADYFRGKINNDELADTIGLNQEGLMYLFRNRERYYGAAGILSRDILKRLVPDVNQYVLPYSLHELVFIPDRGVISRDVLDGLMGIIEEECIAKEEQLNDHCYYYDAKTGEICSC